MRKLAELSEEICEVNYFLKEWQRLKIHPEINGSILQQPELRFIARTIEHLINESQLLNSSLILKVEKLKNKNVGTCQKKNLNESSIELTKYFKTVDHKGDRISYVGNRHGLLSVSKLSEMFAGGG